MEMEVDNEEGRTSSSCPKCILKAFLLILLVPLIFCAYLLRDIVAIVAILVLSIFVGMFGFSFELMTRTQGARCILLALFFPITMILGIGVAFKEIFCQLGSPFFGAFVKSTSKKAKAILKL